MYFSGLVTLCELLSYIMFCDIMSMVLILDDYDSEIDIDVEWCQICHVGALNLQSRGCVSHF